MILEGYISILFDHDGLEISIGDRLSTITFVEARLDREQTCQALSRLGYYTKCKIDVRGIDSVGKKHERKAFEFELPEDCDWGNGKEVAKDLAEKLCPDGWVASTYFGSQNSFFKKDGKKYARTTIERWV